MHAPVYRADGSLVVVPELGPAVGGIGLDIVFTHIALERQIEPGDASGFPHSVVPYIEYLLLYFHVLFYVFFIDIPHQLAARQRRV